MTPPADTPMIVLFGATGDLTKRKLIPALLELLKKGAISEKSPIVGVSRSEKSTDQFIASLKMQEYAPNADDELRARFAKQLTYVDFDTEAHPPERLRKHMEEIEKRTECGPNRLIYLALPAEAFEATIVAIRESGMLSDQGWRRICFEKPFGHDLASAHELNAKVASFFDEKEIYRIDHYLGKELVRDILVLRFANALFEQVWNNTFVEQIQITIAETLGVEGRGGYYEGAGAIRDMIQNHMLQVLSMAAMEVPVSMESKALRDEKVRVLRALRRPAPGDLVIGQYDGGEIDGEKVPAYRAEEGVEPKSTTETFAALRVAIDNDRWRGVPFYMRTGKRLGKKVAEINVVLRDTDNRLFFKEGLTPASNVITIRIQPHEGISVLFNTKETGEGMNIHQVSMDHSHHALYGMNTPEAYEILLHEMLRGDQTLFTRWDFVELSWRYVENVLALAEEQRKQFPNYPAGSFGPKAADELLARDGRKWMVSHDIPD